MRKETGQERNLWEIRAVRQAIGLALLLAAVFFAWRIRAILIPIGVAFLLSYAAEPPVAALKQRLGLPRGVSAALCLLLAAAAAAIFWAWAVPKLTGQVNELIARLPDYARFLRDQLGIETGQIEEFIKSLREGSSREVDQAVRLGDLVAAGAPRLFGFVGTIASATAYAVLALFLLVVFFFIFVTYKGWGRGIGRVVPTPYAESCGRVLGYMDLALGAYVRGQLLVALFTFTGFSIGFFLADVPDWFVVALIGGFFSLIPYGQVSGVLLAVTLKLMEAQVGGAEFSWWGVFLAPLLVYSITQSLETWVITPLVQGEMNKLHPAVILTVLILGGAVAGVVGLILAIPVAATIRASLREFVLDRSQ